ncbi:hypothetical protein [Chryseobacterium pennipullorum]|uniref:Uncharacterized protein n=1 Tax=Chryseobacterium pennipullorum TaxID=2258963 RepID=A0A3D9B787_9FLAO|nr:hypothetical protein [Chryseobacterium pennipullorum]REC49116.1 hypothetical protein DRF67_06075 [Chryseobacterium pennipullorum]
MVIQIIYIAVLVAAAVKSTVLAGKKSLSSQNFLTIFLTVSLGLEIYGHYKIYIREFDFAYMFNYYSIFMIVFFYSYYQRIFSGALKTVSLYVVMAILAYILVFVKFYDEHYQNQLGILVCLYFIINTLVWFYTRLKNYDEIKITDDPHFWVSCGLLFWSIFFIFRSIPMFFLKDNDPAFLEILKNIQYGVNIVMYGMFYIALVQFDKSTNRRSA